MKHGTRLLALALALGMGLTLAACGDVAAPEESAAPTASEQPTPTPTPDPAGQTVLTVCMGAEPATLDPALNTATWTSTLLYHTFEGLMKWADSGETDGAGLLRVELVCGQAERYDRAENADGTVRYTFHLRDGAAWSDGNPVTAHDFVYAWQRLVDESTGAGYAYLLDCVVRTAGELAVEAVDDATFAVTVQDCPDFLQRCALPATFPVRQDVIEGEGGNWIYDPETYLCNGPYVLEGWEHYSSITLAANEHYYLPAKGPEHIVFTLSDNGEGAMSAWEDGTLDFSTVFPAERTAELLKAGTLAREDYAGSYFLLYQTAKAPFDDARVRRAFSLAIDRDVLVETLGGGQAPAGGTVPAGISDAAGGDFRSVGGDLLGGSDTARHKQAQELLAAAGYPEGKDFPAVEYLYNTGDTHAAVAQALQQMWQEVLGVTVTLRGEPWSTYRQSRRDGDFSIARSSWLADVDDPAPFLSPWRSDAAENDARYAGDDYDALLDAAERAEGAERMERLHQAEEILVDGDCAVCPLYDYTRLYLLRKGVEGVGYSPLGYFFFAGAQRR